ncbi:MAG: glutamine--fructose-6-phosphate transaminase (isomerizing) [Candidatus Aenigmatarchaeota archaeon]
MERLEYRGYDSAGLAFLNDSGIQVSKATGTLDELDFDSEDIDGEINTGIGHTRWATHGDVSKENAHPHSSCKGRFVLAHNGIIENWKELKEQLNNHTFESETDSEAAVHYIEEKADKFTTERAIQDFMEEVEGSYAITLLDSKQEKLYVMKSGSPIVIGINEEEVFVASDVYAFSPYTDKVMFLKDEEYAVVEEGNVTVKDKEGKEVERGLKTVQWEQESSEKEGFEHYMHKEIKEIPNALKKLQNSLDTTQNERLKKFAEKIKDHGKVVFAASGTSYHASLLGVYFLQKAGVEARAFLASELGNYDRVDDDTLLIPVSQSGETKDVLEAMKYARNKGAEIASITNVPHSTVERKSDINLRIKSGQEVCVAATKTFTNQVYALMRIAEEMDGLSFERNIESSLREVIERNEEPIKELAEELKEEEDIYIIGKGESFPVAREISLKLKEIAYIHAEGMLAGGLKHGTLALIEEGTPVISLIPEKDSDMISNVKEAESREARTIRISPHYGDFYLPETENGDFSFFAAAIGFLLTYWIAREKGLPIDKPRNLAKSVTVQ